MKELVKLTASKEYTDRNYLTARIYEVPNSPMLIGAAMGLCGEAGEFSELVKKSVFQGKDFNPDHAKKELGDILWYFTLACLATDISIEEIEEIVTAKLKARYSNGFSYEEANNRKKDDI